MGETRRAGGLADQPPEPAEPVSLRERKKARTRAALIEVSQRLFAEQGYAGTTLDEICDEVEIRPKTLLRYFESKAHLAFAPMTDPLDRLRAHLEEPGRRHDALDVWREYVTRECREVGDPTSATTVSHLRNLRRFRCWADKDPVLVAMASDVERRLRHLLAASVARDDGVDTDDLHPVLLAAQLVAGRAAVWDRWLARDEGDADAGALLADQLLVIDHVVENRPRPRTDRTRTDRLRTDRLRTDRLRTGTT